MSDELESRAAFANQAHMDFEAKPEGNTEDVVTACRFALEEMHSPEMFRMQGYIRRAAETGEGALKAFAESWLKSTDFLIKFATAEVNKADQSAASAIELIEQDDTAPTTPTLTEATES